MAHVAPCVRDATSGRLGRVLGCLLALRAAYEVWEVSEEERFTARALGRRSSDLRNRSRQGPGRWPPRPCGEHPQTIAQATAAAAKPVTESTVSSTVQVASVCFTVRLK